MFFGAGWNEDAAVPGEDPPQSDDYVGGMLRAGVIHELAASWAVTGQLGGQQGRRTLGDETAEPEPVTVSYALYFATAGARWQTRPSRFGGYVEAGGGVALGRVDVTRPQPVQDDAEGTSDPTFLGYAAAGGTVHVTRGVDLFLEARFATAPDAVRSFTSEDDLDLGGASATAGVSLRL